MRGALVTDMVYIDGMPLPPEFPPEITLHWVCGSVAKTLGSETEGTHFYSTIGFVQRSFLSPVIVQLTFVIQKCERLENFMRPEKWISKCVGESLLKKPFKHGMKLNLDPW